MSLDGVILYDLSAKDGRAWSLNSWKTRLILNYKGIPYKTEWVEFPDIAAKGKSLGVTPNTKALAATDYSIPMVEIPSANGLEAHMNSALIAPVLEKIYPEPSLHLDAPAVAKVAELLPKALLQLAPDFMPRAPGVMMNPRSVEYFERTRAERFGMSLAELQKAKGGDQAWQGAEGPLREIAAVLKEDPAGPYCMGKTVSYADFYIVAAMYCFSRVDQALFERFVAVDGVFKELYDALKPWFEKDQ